MASRIAFPGTINPGDAVGATPNNNLPGGKIGRAIVTSDSAGTTTSEQVGTVTVVVGASREIDVHVQGNLRATDANALGCGVQVKVLCDGVQIGRKNGYIPKRASAGVAQDYSFAFWFTHHPSSGSRVYTFWTGVSGAFSETVTCIASADTGTQGATLIEVFDQGPSF